MRDALSGVLTLVFILSGCLVSEDPLVQSVDYPQESGTTLQILEVSADNTATKLQKFAQLDIDSQGFYRLTSADGNSIWHQFKVSRITGSPYFLAVAPTESDTFYYAIIEEVSVFDTTGYIHYIIDREMFERYIRDRQDKIAGWRISGDYVYINSLAFLQTILPEMVEGGYYKDRSVYAVSDAPPEASAPQMAAPVQAERERLAAECENGRSEACNELAGRYTTGSDGDLVDYGQGAIYYGKACDLGDGAACFAALFWAAAVIAEKTDSASHGGPAATADESGEWKAQFWCWTEFSDPDPVDKPTWCRNSAGYEWEMGPLTPCYRVEGWCDG
jgi:hypothetical protein